MDDPHPPLGIDITVPSAARIYDYGLGGKDNYEADREAAERVLAIAPGMRAMARQQRAWLGRVVPAMSAEGIDQWVDIGSGLPTRENVHQVAQRLNPKARVVYVDNDPTVIIHGRSLLFAENEHTEYFEADARDPEIILQHPDTRRLIAFDRPVGLILAAILPFIPDEDDPAGLVARYAALLPSGSLIAISHPTDEVTDELAARIKVLYADSKSKLNLRSRAEIVAMADGLEMLEPGVVETRLWRAEEIEPAGEFPALAMLLRKP